LQKNLLRWVEGRKEIIEYCESADIFKREIYYLDLFKPEYNICHIAGSSLGRITRDETRLKLRNA
jgi:hypothetical protein